MFVVWFGHSTVISEVKRLEIEKQVTVQDCDIRMYLAKIPVSDEKMLRLDETEVQHRHSRSLFGIREVLCSK